MQGKPCLLALIKSRPEFEAGDAGAGREGLTLYPTLQVYPATPMTDAYLSHDTVPIEVTDEDLIMRAELRDVGDAEVLAAGIAGCVDESAAPVLAGDERLLLHHAADVAR